MIIHPSIKSRLQRIPWFRRCGINEELDIDVPYELVPTWQEATSLFSDLNWEATTAEAQAKLTEHLSSRFPAQYQGQWNRMAKETHAIIDEIVMPSARAFQAEINLPQVFLDCVQWDVLHGVMELSYAECSPRPFFRILLDVYEKGHFPCGWVGEWPDGVLLLI